MSKTPGALANLVDGARSFLSTLLKSSIEESGLLIKDQITMLRFKNQVKMVNKAKAICEKNKISPKIISVKLLVPLLECSGLEEDEEMLDKWATLLSNLVDSEQNIQNHVFPYLLSQISKKEYDVLAIAFDTKFDRIKKTLKKWNEETPGSKYRDIEEKWLYKSLQMIIDDSLEDFEIQNLMRLGLLKEEKEIYTKGKTFPVTYSSEVEVDIDIETDEKVVLTILGEKFIAALTEKNKL